MFRHRKRLISKRLSKLMRKKNEKYMKQLFAKFIESRSQQMQGLVPQEQESASDQEIIEEQISEQEIEEVEDEGTQEMSLTDYIETLSPADKRQFKLENPELPPTFFMSKKEKEKFFIRKNSKFQNDLKHTPTRTSKNNHHVQFKEKFMYKPFSNYGKVVEVKKAKEFNVPYNSKIHFS